MLEYLYLLITAFISATLLPLGSEALLLYQLSQDLNIYLLFLFATIGNSLGSVLNYWLGLKGEHYLLQKKSINKNQIQKAQYRFNRFGGYSLLLSWMPIIGDPITFIAGMAKYNFNKFLILVIIAKSGRYLFVIGSYHLYLLQ